VTIANLDAPTSKEVGFLIHRDTLQFPGTHFPSTPVGVFSKSVDYTVPVRPTVQSLRLIYLDFTGTPVKELTFLERLIAPLVNSSIVAEIYRFALLQDIESFSPARLISNL